MVFLGKELLESPLERGRGSLHVMGSSRHMLKPSPLSGKLTATHVVVFVRTADG